MAHVAPYTASNNMVFSGVANGEALWGHPQMVSADSPEAFGGEWSANNVMQQQPQQPQPLQQQPQSSQQQHINLSRHQYPLTAATAHGQYHEHETNLLDGISWASYDAMI